MAVVWRAAAVVTNRDAHRDGLFSMNYIPRKGSAYDGPQESIVGPLYDDIMGATPRPKPIIEPFHDNISTLETSLEPTTRSAV